MSSAPATTKPCASRAISGGSQLVCGDAPIITNRPSASTSRSVPVASSRMRSCVRCSVAAAVDHAAAQEHLHVVCGADGVDEVLRHAPLECVAADYNGHLLGPLGEVECGLTDGVAGTHQVDAAILVLLRFGRRRAVEDAKAGEPLEARDLEPSVGDAHREDDGPRREPATVSGAQDMDVVAPLHRRDLGADQEAAPERPRLLISPVGQLGTAHTARKPR